MDLKMEVYSPGLELLGLLEIQRSVIWAEKAFSAGSFSLESLITEESLALLQPDNIIWIEGDTAGVIEYVQQQAGRDGPYITVKGRTLAGLLERRVLWGLYSLKGTPPEIMHVLVNDCCINPTRGNAEARKIPGLVALDAPAGGETIRFQKTGGTLLEALEQLGETYGVAFGVRFNPAVPQMEFWTRWGQNRSIHQTSNEPVLYSTELDDVLSSEYSYNSQDFRNVALVAGEGEGVNRVYVTVNGSGGGDTPGQPDTPNPPDLKKYTVTVDVDPAGSGTATGGRTVESGTRITVTASPLAGFAFAGWRENGEIVSTDAKYTFTVTGNCTLTAVFAALISNYTVTVSVDPDGGGTATGGGTYEEGTQVTVTAAAADGYSFSRWMVNGEEVKTGSRYTFTVTGDTEVVAVFKASRLPNGYTEVEYVIMQSSSTTLAYIKPGINTVISGRYELDVEYGELSGTTWILNTDTATTTLNGYNADVYCRFYATAASIKYSVGYSESYKTFSVGSTQGRHELTIDWKNNMMHFDNQSKAIFSSTPTSKNMTGKSIRIFAPSNAPVKCYSIKTYSNDTPSRDMVPCIGPSNVAGFYDLVKGSFYTLTGTGTITPGPAV